MPEPCLCLSAYCRWSTVALHTYIHTCTRARARLRARPTDRPPDWPPPPPPHTHTLPLSHILSKRLAGWACGARPLRNWYAFMNQRFAAHTGIYTNKGESWCNAFKLPLVGALLYHSSPARILQVQVYAAWIVPRNAIKQAFLRWPDKLSQVVVYVR